MIHTIIKTLKKSLVNNKGSYNLKEDEVLPPKGFLQTRYMFCILVFMGMTLAFADRMVLNVAIVGMVNRSN